VPEVIPLTKGKAYAAVPVHRVLLEALLPGRAGQEVVVGADIGKFDILAVPRGGNADCGRPWRVHNPEPIPTLVRLLVPLTQGRRLRVALEPSGTYGNALRQAWHDAGSEALRVRPQAAHDYAAICDGVPSQHDGKDAAVVAEWAALGKAAPGPYAARPPWEQELAYGVDGLDAHRQWVALGSGRREALLARHGPEATRVLTATPATLLHAPARYGGPADLAADARAAARLAHWGGHWLEADTVPELLQGARRGVGVRPGEVAKRRMRAVAGQVLAARQQVRSSLRRLRRLVRGQPVLEAHARVVGCGTACVLGASVGDPRDYPCGAAYARRGGSTGPSAAVAPSRGGYPSASAATRGRDSGCIGRRCGWPSRRVCARGRRPRRVVTGSRRRVRWSG
jgi:hypothetical protein